MYGLLWRRSVEIRSLELRSRRSECEFWHALIDCLVLVTTLASCSFNCASVTKQYIYFVIRLTSGIDLQLGSRPVMRCD